MLFRLECKKILRSAAFLIYCVISVLFFATNYYSDTAFGADTFKTDYNKFNAWWLAGATVDAVAKNWLVNEMGASDYTANNAQSELAWAKYIELSTATGDSVTNSGEGVTEGYIALSGLVASDGTTVDSLYASYTFSTAGFVIEGLVTDTTTGASYTGGLFSATDATLTDAISSIKSGDVVYSLEMTDATTVTIAEATVELGTGTTLITGAAGVAANTEVTVITIPEVTSETTLTSDGIAFSDATTGLTFTSGTDTYSAMESSATTAWITH